MPDHVAAALDRGLERLPADRFQTAAEFARALESAGAETTRRTRTGATGSAVRSGRVGTVAGVLGWAGPGY